MNGKAWYRSKTIWLNAAAAAVLALEAQLGVLQPVLPIDIYVLLATVLPAVNVILRGVTGGPISLRGGSG